MQILELVKLTHLFVARNFTLEAVLLLPVHLYDGRLLVCCWVYDKMCYFHLGSRVLSLPLCSVRVFLVVFF